MLTEYIQAAMRLAHYDLLADQPDAPYYGEIAPCQGVWANAATLEACRDELQEVLEDWIVFRLRRGLNVPPIDGHALAVAEAAAEELG